MSKAAKTALVMIGVLALTIFLFWHQNRDFGTWFAVALAMTLIFVAMFVPVIGDFIVERPRAIFWIGIAIVAGGFIVPLGWFAASGHVPAADESDPMQWVTVYAMVIGICLTVLPRSIAAHRETQSTLERASAQAPPDASLSLLARVGAGLLGLCILGGLIWGDQIRAHIPPLIWSKPCYFEHTIIAGLQLAIFSAIVFFAFRNGGSGDFLSKLGARIIRSKNPEEPWSTIVGYGILSFVVFVCAWSGAIDQCAQLGVQWP